MKVSNLRARIARRIGCTAKRVARQSSYLAGAAILGGGMMFAGQVHCATLFSEDFESLTLGPFVSTSEGGGDGTDWTDELPSGWTRDNTTTPEGGPVEFFGWTFLDKDSWNATAGQGRSDFALAEGTVAVADGDEYDDLGAVLGGDSQAMNVFLMTPEVSLQGVQPDSAEVNFDSSFFPYDVQTGLVDVSFDAGATWNNLLTLDSAALGNSSAARKNESINLNLGAQAGDESAMIRFGYLTADNDWWWAIDNLEVAGKFVPDVNGDGVVDIFDFETIRDNMFTGTTFAEGDVNSDGITNLADFGLWEEFFMANPGGAPASVPEPATLALLAIGGLFAGCATLRWRGDL